MKFLYSGKESLTSLEDIISAKYSAVFKIEGCYVYGQDGVEDYFTNQKHTCAMALPKSGSVRFSDAYG